MFKSLKNHIKSKRKPKSLRNYIFLSMIRVLLNLFILIMGVYTIIKAKDIMYTKSFYIEKMLEDYYKDEILTMIDTTRFHSEQEIYSFAVKMKNKITLTQLDSINDNSIQWENDLVEDINPYFEFTIPIYANSTRGFPRTNMWYITDMTLISKGKSSGDEEYIIMDSDVTVEQQSLSKYYTIPDYMNPSKVVDLYDMCYGERRYIWEDADEVLIYETEDGIFAIKFIKDRNLENGEYAEIALVNFEINTLDNEIYCYAAKKDDIQQFYINTPLTERDIEARDNLVFKPFSDFYDFLYYDFLFHDDDDIDYFKKEGFLEEFSLFKTECSGRFPITEYIELVNSNNNKMVPTKEFIYYYFSFSPILLAMKALLPIYLVGVLILLISCFFISDKLSKFLGYPLELLPKQMRKGVAKYDLGEEIIEFVDLAKEIDEFMNIRS